MEFIQVLKTEAQKDPLILFIRNVEKSILGNFERYIKLETLKDVRLVVIGSHTSDQSKEKVRNTLRPLSLDICNSNLVEVKKCSRAEHDPYSYFFIFSSYSFLDGVWASTLFLIYMETQFNDCLHDVAGFFRFSNHHKSWDQRHCPLGSLLSSKSLNVAPVIVPRLFTIFS